MTEMDRRAFLKKTAAAAAGAMLATDAFGLFMQEVVAKEPRLREASYYTKLSRQRIQCQLCPLNCHLEEGATCFCRTRTNKAGKLYNDAFDNPCVVRLDPIEKTPLHHFLPGTQALAIGTGGCNLRCLYCQNWEQSQSVPARLRNMDLPSKAATQHAEERDCRTIAYTYTEPVVFYDYMLELATFAKSKGIRNVVATAGYINPNPLRKLCGKVDGFAVALKGFNDDYYTRVLGVQLKPVLEALELIAEQGVWLEIVNLVVPTLNDDPKEIRVMCKWIRKHLGANVPLHFARFVPMYKLKNLPRTPITTLDACRQIGFEEGLRFVYTSNVAPHEGNHTFCPECKTKVIERIGFKTLANHMNGKRCPNGHKLPGVF